jgi:hypothetical protein
MKIIHGVGELRREGTQVGGSLVVDRRCLPIVMAQRQGAMLVAVARDSASTATPPRAASTCSSHTEKRHASSIHREVGVELSNRGFPRHWL